MKRCCTWVRRKVSLFVHRNNTFFSGGHDVPTGGLADPNREPGFSKDDPKLAGGIGTDYSTWMATGRSHSSSRGIGHRGNTSK